MLKSWAKKGAVAIVAMCALIVGAPATPAAAGTCSTPGCGGYVINSGSSGAYVFVANNWCWGGTGSFWYGSTLPCATTWNAFAYNSYFLLAPGDSTLNYSYYYDTDAIRINAGCMLVFYNGTNNTIDNRSSSSHLWMKLTDISGFTVTYQTCS